MDPGAEYDSRITPREQTQNMEPVNEDQEEEMDENKGITRTASSSNIPKKYLRGEG